MTDTRQEAIMDSGFQFFGEMTGSISHEIKNCMAVINENAGLLQDLILLSQKGTPPDLDRLNRVAEQILLQIKRSDAFVKKLNRFSHSVDTPINSIDLAEILNFSLDLSKRIAANRRFTLSLEPPPETIIISTHVFYFMNMIWRCLDFIMGKGAADSQLTIKCKKNSDGVEICFGPLKKSDEPFDVGSMPGSARHLLEILNGTIELNDGQGEMILTLPEKI